MEHVFWDVLKRGRLVVHRDAVAIHVNHQGPIASLCPDDAMRLAAVLERYALAIDPQAKAGPPGGLGR